MIFLCIFGAVVTSAAAYFIYKLSRKQKSYMSAAFTALAASLLLSIGLEATLFNINYYTTHSYKETLLSVDESGQAVGGYALLGGSTLEFPVNVEIKNICIKPSAGSEKIKFTLHLTDEANKNYFSTPARTVYRAVKASQYINVHTSGRSTSLALNIDSDIGSVGIASVSINAPRPFELSFLRIVLTVAAAMLLYIFAPASPLYKMKLINRRDISASPIVSFICIECAVIIFLGSINPTFSAIGVGADGKITTVRLGMENHNQYDELAEAILEKGVFYIDNGDIPESLAQMENPYDTHERSVVSSKTGDHFRWDVAYFNNHYYVYFGLVPLVLLYLPFRAVTGSPFPSSVGVMIFAAIFALGVFLLLREIAEKRFKNISVGTFLLTALGVVNFSGMIFLAKRPDFYSVPIMCACAFSVFGMLLWLKALDGAKKRSLLLFFGALFMALSVGCRPQSVLVSAVALPLFIPEFFGKGKFNIKKTVKDIIPLAVPYISVAAVIMYYNFARFGSPFDFGSSYNLTTNDVTRRGFEFARTGLGLFTYLFQTPKFTAVFPFLTATQISTSYVGKTIWENCFGGFITCTPICWFIFPLGAYRASLKQSRLTGFAAVLFAVSVALVVADTQAGGLLQRYYSDFGYLLLICAALAIFSLADSAQMPRESEFLKKALLVSTIFGVFYTSALAFSVSDVTIDVQNPELFGKLSHAVQFWL